MERPGFVDLSITKQIPALLEKLGIPSQPFLADAGLRAGLLEEAVGWTSFTALSRLLLLCADKAECSHVGLLVGRRARLSDFGVIGSLMETAETLGEALGVLQTHWRIVSEGATFHLNVNDGEAVLSYLPYAGGHGTGLVLEAVMAAIMNVFRDLCGPDWTLSEVHLPRRVPGDHTPYRSFFGAAVWFNRETAALVFPARLLTTELAGANPERGQAWERRAILLEHNTSHDIVHDLRRILRIELSKGRWSAANAASCFYIHRRTLNRRLRASGTGFKQLANELRFAIAQQLVLETDIPLVEISSLLDFSEPAGFTHAFQRWSGVAPSVMRGNSRSEGAFNGQQLER